VRPGIANRALRCMDSVVPEDVIVFVWSGRAENELGIGQRFEFDRVARRLASREVPVSQFVQGSTRRPMRWRTRGGVSPWRLVKGDAGALDGYKEDARWNAGTSQGPGRYLRWCSIRVRAAT
jgi:hypothetical protein